MSQVKSTPQVEVQLFDNLKIFVVLPNGRREVSITGHRERKLIAYLACRAGKNCYRKKDIAEVLTAPDRMPHVDKAMDRHILDSVKNQLASEKLEGILEANPQWLCLFSEGFKSDVAEFVMGADEVLHGKQTEIPQLIKVVALYRSNLLEEFYTASIDRDPYAKWINNEREYLKKQYIRVLGLLSKKSEQAKNLQEALKYATMALGADPSDAFTNKRLMNLYAKQNNWKEVWAQYDTYLDVCQKSSVEPEHSVFALSYELRMRYSAEQGRWDDVRKRYEIYMEACKDDNREPEHSTFTLYVGLLMQHSASKGHLDDVRRQYKSYQEGCKKAGRPPAPNMEELYAKLIDSSKTPPPIPPSTSDQQVADHLVHKGCVLWKERTEASLRKSIQHFEYALELIPNHAHAKVGISDAYSLLGYYSFISPHLAYKKALEAVNSVLQSDPKLPQALTARAWIAMVYERNWEEARSLFHTSISLDPENETTRQWYSFFLMIQKTFTDSQVEILLAANDCREGQKSPIVSKSIGQRFHYEGNYVKAVEAYKHSLSVYPRRCLTLYCLAQSYEQLALEAERNEDEDEKKKYSILAIEAFNRALRDHHLINYPAIVAGLGHVYAKFGEQDQAEDILAQLHQRMRDGSYVSPVALATVLVGLEKVDETIKELEKALYQRPGDLVLVGIDPRFKPLASEAHFIRILDKINEPGKKSE